MHDYQNHKGRDMEKPSLADRELIEEIAQIELTASPPYMFYLLSQCRIALLAHEQQRSQAAAGQGDQTISGAESGSQPGAIGPAADPPRSQAAAMPSPAPEVAKRHPTGRNGPRGTDGPAADP